MVETKIFDHSSELQGQEGSSKWPHDMLVTHTFEYFTETRALKIENAIVKVP